MQQPAPNPEYTCLLDQVISDLPCPRCRSLPRGKTLAQHMELDCQSLIRGHIQRVNQKFQRPLFPTLSLSPLPHEPDQCVPGPQSARHEGPDNCPICCFALDEHIDSLCMNGHFMHIACIVELRDHCNKKCPICRENVGDRLAVYRVSS